VSCAVVQSKVQLCHWHVKSIEFTGECLRAVLAHNRAEEESPPMLDAKGLDLVVRWLEGEAGMVEW
jgi:hypothetical protein